MELGRYVEDRKFVRLVRFLGLGISAPGHVHRVFLDLAVYREIFLRLAEDAVLALSLEETLCHFRGLLRLMSVLNMLMVYSIAFALASFLVDWVDRPETPFLTGIRHQLNSHCMFSTP